ncbi:MAG: pyrroloquinoline quinone biosynthesis protein PqqB, partial [Flavobacteriaceae bacterium]|nr:pyrroloquinoline quinone biosynthesis protein PqqB [Flavobacteriaceae bacterium]
PWSQLVDLGNIKLVSLTADSIFWLENQIGVRAFEVPHRDEFSETVGFDIKASDLNFLFIPDIDKWEKWDRDIREEIKAVDYAFVDATFFDNGELPNRDMSEIPHPFVVETISLLDTMESVEKSKVYFMHFNHTNPLLFDESARKRVWEQGFNIAREGARIEF